MTDRPPECSCRTFAARLGLELDAFMRAHICIALPHLHRVAVENDEIAEQVIAGFEEPPAPRRRRWLPPKNTHGFQQDHEEAPARLCKECGMWPEHHNHGRGACVCAECMPEASDLPGYDANHVAPPVHRGPMPADWEVPNG